MGIIPPDGAAGLTAAWLSHALSHGRQPVRIDALEVERLKVQGFAGELFRLKVETDSTTVSRSLIAKFACPTPDQRSRQWDLGMYRTEAGFYRELSGATAIPIPNCYYSFVSRRRDLFLLILEEVPGTPGDDTRGLTWDEAAAIVDVAARLHAQWWNDPGLSARRWLQSWQTHPNLRARSENRRAWADLSHHVGRLLPSDLKEVASSRRALREAPQTLIHGDLSAKNVVFGERAEPRSIHLLDWQLARRGPAMVDIANLLAVGLKPDDHRKLARALIERYHAQLSARLGTSIPFNDLVREYRAALTLRCLRPLALASYTDPIDPVGVLAAREVERTLAGLDFALADLS